MLKTSANEGYTSKLTTTIFGNLDYFSSIQYNTIQYNTIQYNTIPPLYII